LTFTVNKQLRAV